MAGVGNGLPVGRSSDEPIVQVTVEIDALSAEKSSHWCQQVGEGPRSNVEAKGHRPELPDLVFHCYP